MMGSHRNTLHYYQCRSFRDLKMTLFAGVPEKVDLGCSLQTQGSCVVDCKSSWPEQEVLSPMFRDCPLALDGYVVRIG